MSDEDVTHKEDRDNLMYIYKQIKLQRSQQEQDPSEKGSSSSSDFVLPLKCFESDINLFNVISKQVGPEAFNDPEIIIKTKPFDLMWTYGINSRTGIINLTRRGRKEIFFASTHFPVLYNYSSKHMKCLEGHQHIVTSITADQSGQYLATAADAKDSCVMIWDSFGPKLVYTLFNVYTLSGTFVVKLSGHAKYLITAGIRHEGSYSVDMWLWTYGNDKPDDTFEIEKYYGQPVEVCFNPNIEEFIMVICKKQVFFLAWDAEGKKIITSKTPHIKNPNRIGLLTTGTYLYNCHECYACSNKGCILVFANTLYSKPYEEGELNNSKLFKNAVKVSVHALLSCGTTTNFSSSLLVIGDASGAILFFDRTIRILYWFKNFDLAPVVSISFEMIKSEEDKSAINESAVTASDSNIFQSDFVDITKELEKLFKDTVTQDNNNRFIVDDFFIATLDSNVYIIDSLNQNCVPIFQIADDYVSAMEAHRYFPYILIGYANGRLHLIDHEKNELVCTILLPETEGSTSISCLKYSPDSFQLVCGRENGEIWILEPILLKPKTDVPYRPTNNKVVKIVFSLNKLQFAYYDDNRTVVLFVYNIESREWIYVGKSRSHYDFINDIMFMPSKFKSVLYTIGCDRYLVEYNNNRIAREEFGIANRDRIEQKSIPMTFIYWYEIVSDKVIDYFLIADNQHKFKLIDVNTRIPKAVILAPAFGCFRNQSISKMMIFPHTGQKILVFLTHKYIGLHIALPDGNPYKYVGYLGHPSKVVDFLLDPDGKYMFTFGQDDHCVFKWKVKKQAVELMHLLGGKELEPFYCLIEGGKNGWLFQEIKDLFYYMQILQHESLDYPRKVSDTINLSELPQLVRTCGFFPTEFELENMMIDIKYRNYHETGSINTEINFIDFIKLFCNHKPAYGYSKEQIQRAFGVISWSLDNPHFTEINRDEFSSELAYSGEPINPSHLVKLLKTLTRSDYPDDDLEFLPEKITFETFYEDILGIDTERMEVLDSEPENESGIFSKGPSVPNYN